MNKNRKFRSFISLLCAVVLLLSSGVQGYAAENTDPTNSSANNNPDTVLEELTDASVEEPDIPEETEEPEEPVDNLAQEPDAPEKTEEPGETADTPGKQPDVLEEPRKPDALRAAKPLVEAFKKEISTDEGTPSQEEGPPESEEPDSEVPKLANGVISIENGIIINEDGTIEYGTPEEGQEYIESTVDVGLKEADYFNRYDYRAAASFPALLDIAEKTKELNVNIRKRAQWVDETDGDAKITLQYESNAGELSITPSMNVILIHDKSGSMDANYGYNLELARQGWEEPDTTIYYPILNTKSWSEAVSSFEADGAEYYKARINGPNDFTSSMEGYAQADSGKTVYCNNEMKFNSPCQEDNHYYLVIYHDATTNIPAWTMVSGSNLYNIASTDLHHYEKVTKKQADEYIEEGRRVVRITSGYYMDASGTSIEKEDGNTISETNPVYFLDVSQLHEFDSKWILSTCAESDCLTNDRLAKSQVFMDEVVNRIFETNPDNQIAYVPYWGDVPYEGSWQNLYGNSEHNGLVEAANAEMFTYKEGVTRLDFTSDASILQEQIDNPFTYNGTNWSRAFQSAIDLLNSRSDEDKEKETLVLFFTDGMPQGCIGSDYDLDNPAINGKKQIEEIKNIKGVAVWAIGVCTSKQDKQSIRNRMEKIDSRPFIIETQEQFDGLASRVWNRVNETYVEEINGTHAFYHDTLSEYFVLDEEALDSTWEVLSGASQRLENGVPENVYEAVDGTGITHVYVRSTKTVYWYIGSMTNGEYEEAGHTFSFPVKFLKYSEHTDGADKALAANTSQYITYYKSTEPDVLCSLEIDAPQIIFNRKDSEISVQKNVSGVSDRERTYHFVYSKDQYESGEVENVLGSFDITISAGSRSGAASITGLEDGTYYIYEVDIDRVIINPDVETAVVDYHPTISTKSYGGGIPYSITKSDAKAMPNLDNYLILASEDTVSFDSGALTVVKEIDCGEDVIWWDHGNPTFIVRIKGTGIDGKEYVFYHTFEFTETYVEENQADGKVSMSYTFTDIPISEEYVVEEERASRYELSSVSIEGQDDLSVGNVLQNNSENYLQFYGLCAEVNLKLKPEGVSVVLYNEKVNYTWFNHITSIENIIED